MKIALSSLTRGLLRALGLTGVAAGAAMSLSAPAAAAARAEVVPFLEVQQVLNADLNGGDTLTYTSVAAGIDGAISTRRVHAQISYRYERRIGWGNDLEDSDVHSGIAQLSAEVVPDTVTINAGALAARSRVDGRGPVFGFSGGDDVNVADVYSLYAGPDLSTQVGPLQVAAGARLGYVKVDNHELDDFVFPGASSDRYDSSTQYSINGSVGMAPGELPVGWTVGAGYWREDVNRLDQKFDGYYVRGDLIFPVSDTLALTGGIGYEEIQSSQSDVLRNSNGVPIVTPGGNLIEDESAPRLFSYDHSGLIWDVGVIWRPSRRTELQARAGQRYGSETFTASLEHQIGRDYAVSASIYDSVTSFGRVLVTDFSSLPVGFRSNRNPLNPGVGGVGGCIFGNEAGSGVCLDDALQSISNASFRLRGANILFSGRRGPWELGVGAGYAHRKYHQAVVLPALGLERVSDESFSLYGTATRQLGRDASLGLDAYATWYSSGLSGSDSSFGTGISASYYRSFLFDRLEGYAAAALFTTDSGEFEETGATALVGLRYSF
jgi:hypothetical protein